jgi:hypothetical protein
MSCAQFVLWTLLIATPSLTGCANNDSKDTFFVRPGDDLASVVSKFETEIIKFRRIDLTHSDVPRRASFMLYAEDQNSLNPKVIAVGFDADEKVVKEGVQVVSLRYTKPSIQSFFLQR